MRRFLVVLLIVALFVLGAIAWIVLGPGPLNFAGGSRIALQDYKGPDPTGVPAGLRNASLVERGQYLTRAADCEACHTSAIGVMLISSMPCTKASRRMVCGSIPPFPIPLIR